MWTKFQASFLNFRRQIRLWSEADPCHPTSHSRILQCLFPVSHWFCQLSFPSSSNNSFFQLDDRVWALICMMIFASLHFFMPVICSRTIQIVSVLVRAITLFLVQRAAQHSHFALNLNMVIAGIAQILIPLGVQAAVPDNTRSQASGGYCI